jgi:hypothetical protein
MQTQTWAACKRLNFVDIGIVCTRGMQVQRRSACKRLAHSDNLLLAPAPAAALLLLLLLPRLACS